MNPTLRLGIVHVVDGRGVGLSILPVFFQGRKRVADVRANRFDQHHNQGARYVHFRPIGVLRAQGSFQGLGAQGVGSEGKRSTEGPGISSGTWSRGKDRHWRTNSRASSAPPMASLASCST
mmetsp:Transcript_23973/g.34345  ORF Transcript_23973/g.34345 Transcript_23973/m.34345 type:complete len:121 (-) Transcript_23973:151-513(-)